MALPDKYPQNYRKVELEEITVYIDYHLIKKDTEELEMIILYVGRFKIGIEH